MGSAGLEFRLVLCPICQERNLLVFPAYVTQRKFPPPPTQPPSFPETPNPPTQNPPPNLPNRWTIFPGPQQNTTCVFSFWFPFKPAPKEPPKNTPELCFFRFLPFWLPLHKTPHFLVLLLASFKQNQVFCSRFSFFHRRDEPALP